MNLKLLLIIPVKFGVADLRSVFAIARVKHLGSGAAASNCSVYLKALQPHSVTEARAQGWDRLTNGDLLDAAEEAGFEVLVTPDQNIRYQQNLAGRKIALVILSKAQWPYVKNHATEVAAAVNAATPGIYAEVEIREPGPQTRRGDPGRVFKVEINSGNVCEGSRRYGLQSQTTKPSR